MTQPAETTPQPPTHRAVRKQPEALCPCLRELAEHEFVRFMTTSTPDGKTGLCPALDNHKRGKKGAVTLIAYCPSCGKPTFDVEPITPADSVPA